MNPWLPIADLPTEWDEVPDLEVRGADGQVALAVFDLDDGWMDVRNLDNPVELGFVPVEWRVR